jgi:Flp pilus assembly protein CpaB
MRPIQPTSRRGPSWGALFVGLLFVLATGVLGTVGTMWALGMPLPFMAAAKPVRIRIPTNTRPIPAYAAVTREDLIDFEAQSLKFLELRPEQAVGVSLIAISPTGDRVETAVREARVVGQGIVFVTREGLEIPEGNAVELGGALLSLNDIIGRVVAREKQAGYGFKEENFLPKGTRPGITGGVPPGMQALTLDANRLDGIHALKPGDKVDLMATIPDGQLARFGGSDDSRLPGAALVAAAAKPPRGSQPGEARLLAEGAVLVTPVTARAEAFKSNSLTQGSQVRNMPVQEVVLAVERDDLPGLTEALALEVDLVCIAHSSRPDQQGEPPVPEGLVAVPVAARPVAALSQVVRDDVFHPRTRRQKLIYLTPEEVADKQIVTSYTDLVGRVAAHDLLAGHFVTERDLLPPGTPPGLAAGVPPGKRAFVVETKGLVGLGALSAGDHFDLLASSPVDLSRTGGRGGANLVGGGLMAALPKQADVRVLVHDGVVVAPLKTAAGRGSDAPTIAEVVVAVDPAEVPRVAEALATGVELTVVARSSQGGSPAAVPAPAAETRTPEHHPLDAVKSLEVLVGGKRETVLFLGDGERVVVNRPAAEDAPVQSPIAPVSAQSPAE